MSKMICNSCGSDHIVEYDYCGGTIFAECEICGARGDTAFFTHYENVFDRITASLEVLAEKLVHPTYGMVSRTWDFEKDTWGTAEPTWSSTVLPSNKCYATKEDAVAATIAKLKEAADAEN